MNNLDNDTLNEYLDQIRVTVPFNKFNREDLHVYIPFKNAFYYYRINLNPKLETGGELLFEKEIFDDIDELFEKAYAKAKKFNELKYDAAAVLFVEDELDTPIEDSFDFTIEQKMKLAVVLYVLKGNTPANVYTGD